MNAHGEVFQGEQRALVLNEYVSVKRLQLPPTILIYRFFPYTTFLLMDPICTSANESRLIIKKVKKSSSCGTDGINAKFVKDTIEYSFIILECIFSQSLQDGSLPDDWPIEKVIPVPKSASTSDPNNYRPISLTAIPCKIMERIIYSHLVTFLESNYFFTPAQHGFLMFFSRETRLLAFTNDLNVALDSGSITHYILLNLDKAFDKATHSLLLYKFSFLNIGPNVLSWLNAFFANGTQFVPSLLGP